VTNRRRRATLLARPASAVAGRILLWKVLEAPTPVGAFFMSASYRLNKQSMLSKSAPTRRKGHQPTGRGLVTTHPRDGCVAMSKKVCLSKVKIATSVAPAFYLDIRLTNRARAIAGCPQTTAARGRFACERRWPAIANSRGGTGRTPSAVPSSSNFPASHLGSEPALTAQSCRAFSSSATRPSLRVFAQPDAHAIFCRRRHQIISVPTRRLG
jgi:hypothetical protein